MKKLFVLSLSALALSAPAALAEDGHAHKSRMIEKLDTDKDGVVSKEEFDKANNERFVKIDADSDGKITQDEAQKAKDAWRAHMKDRREAKETPAPAVPENGTGQ